MTNRLRYSILAADLLWVTAAYVLAHLLRFRLLRDATTTPAFPRFYVAAVSTALVVWAFLYFNKGLEGFSRGWHFPTICSQIIVAVFYLMAALPAIGFLTKTNYSRLALFFSGLFLPVGFIAIRYVAWELVKSWSHLGTRRQVAIVGSGRVARELANKIARHPEMMIEVAGFLYPSDMGFSSEARLSKAGTTTVRSLNALDLLRQKNVQELILAEQLPSGPEIEKLIAGCHRAGMQVHLVPQWYELYLSKAHLTEIDDVPMVSVEARSLPPGARGLKRVMDLSVGIVLLGVTSPALVAIWVVLSRKIGNAFKTERRCGQDGTQFSMCRFNVDRWAEDLVGFEKFIARLSLTELPQLWNVIRGEMSLVGPRPEPPERVKHYSVWQRRRLSVKPGLTGQAQVNGLREHHSSEEKAHFDLQYIYHWSLFFDFSLLLQTAWTLTFRLLQGNHPDSKSASRPVDHTRFTIQEALHADSPQSGAD